MYILFAHIYLTFSLGQLKVDVSKEDVPVEEPRERAVQVLVRVDEPKDFKKSTGIEADTEDVPMKVLSDSEVDSDVVSDIEEEEKLCDIEKEEEKLFPKDWAGQVEEEESEPREDLVVDTEQKEAVLSIGEALREEFKKGRGRDREKRIC